MEFYWTEKSGMMWTCHIKKPVTVKTKTIITGELHEIATSDMGYITYWQHTKMWVANTYGSINPTSDSLQTPDFEEAKRYVEEHAIVGITVNKLSL